MLNDIFDSIFIQKSLPYFVNTFAVLLAILAGYLVYSGLTTKTERIYNRLRFKEGVREQKDKFVDEKESSESELIFRKAGNPLGLNALRYSMIQLVFFMLLITNYMVVPFFYHGEISLSVIVILAIVYVVTKPSLKWSLAHWILKKVTEYRIAKRNSELFIFYDLLISEIQMMNSSRVNAYNLIRSLVPFFDELKQPLNHLLSEWNKDAGPQKALDNFVEEIGSQEAESLCSVLRTFDENKRETILKSLKGMEEVFVHSQIENYRRRRKLFVDLANIPIKACHFLIILNFVVVIVYMVSHIMGSADF